MTTSSGRIGFIGGGNMGEAFVGALISAGRYTPDAVGVSDVSTERLRTLEATYGITPMTDNPRLFDQSDVVVLAVKPQQMAAVLKEIVDRPGYGVSEPRLVMSIAAGIRLRTIEGILYPPLDEAAQARLPVIRVMPNTPALVLSGMSVMSPNRHATDADRTTARTLLEATGEVMELPEDQLDAVTGVSGSGPAYVFYLIEAMTEGGVQAGLDPADAVALTLQTVKGAVRLMEARGEAPDALRRKVTSPGGTTEAALSVLSEHRVGEHIAAAVVAAARRATELSGPEG